MPLDWHSLYNAAAYTYGNCTQFVAGTLSWVQRGWGNGCQWAGNATKSGLTVSKTPVVGSIAVYDCSLAGSSGDGHVAVVQAITSNGFTLQEANWQGFNVVDTRAESLTSTTGKHIVGFILPPGSSPPPVDSGVTTDQLLSSSPTGIGQTISAIGQQFAHDLFRVALSMLGFFIALIGIGLLLSSELRQQLETSIPAVGAHGTAARSGLEVADHIDGT